MAGGLITTTRRGTMRPLAVQGIFATDCWHQLRSLLEQRLGPAHANLLAEPVHDPARENVDWHSGVEGTPTPLSALPPEQADAARARIGRMAGEIRALAGEISKDPNGRSALSGQLLLLCLQHPHEDDLWLAGEQPLVCCWGFAPGATGAQPEDLTRLGQAKPAPQTSAAHPKDASLVIPPDAREKNDLSFLDGRWRCETGLANATTGEPIVLEFSFDKSGIGKCSVTEKNGKVCIGPVRAAFDSDGALNIEVDEAVCPDGGGYEPETVQCTGSGSSVVCKGSRGKPNEWDARFYRKKKAWRFFKFFGFGTE